MKPGFACLLFAVSFGLAAAAMAQENELDRQCGLAFNAPSAIGEIPLGDYAIGNITFSGKGAFRTMRLIGPSHPVIGRKGVMPFETLDLLNGQFDTVTVSTAFERDRPEQEIGLRLDPFDTVILDPALPWQLSPDASLAFDAYSARDIAGAVTVLVPPGAFVLTRYSGQGMTTIEGPEGPLVWPLTGRQYPDLRDAARAAEEVAFDYRDGLVTVIELELHRLADNPAKTISLMADPFDQLIIRDFYCWTVQDDIAPGLSRLSSDLEDGRSARVELAGALLASAARGQLKPGTTFGPGLWHLSEDAPGVLDAIDLRNGGLDVLILRNDGRLRDGYRPVAGDPGDEIWLDGSAGWTLGQGPFGIEAHIPTGPAPGQALVLRFSPGMVVRRLPMPPFLQDTALLERGPYPGLRDEVTTTTALRVTRGGYLRLSPNQLANRRALDMTNGRANILAVASEDLANLRSDLVLTGDTGLDTLLTSGLGEPQILPGGDAVWTIGAEAQAPTLTARGLRVFTSPEAPIKGDP